MARVGRWCVGSSSAGPVQHSHVVSSTTTRSTLQHINTIIQCHRFMNIFQQYWKMSSEMFSLTKLLTAEREIYLRFQLNRGSIGTNPQSNLRRERRKGPIGSDDSQVQDRPSPGKPSLRYSPSTRIANYSDSLSNVL